MLIGIDRPAPKGEGNISSWVLGKFTEPQLKILYESRELGMKQAEKLLEEWLHPKPIVEKPQPELRQQKQKQEKNSDIHTNTEETSEIDPPTIKESESLNAPVQD